MDNVIEYAIKSPGVTAQRTKALADAIRRANKKEADPKKEAERQEKIRKIRRMLSPVRSGSRMSR